jgi:hypothetical protein
MTEGAAVASGPRKSATAARNVRAELARAGVTYLAAAEEIGLSYAAFRRRTDGDQDFRAGELEALAQMLGVPLARLTEEPKP